MERSIQAQVDDAPGGRVALDLRQPARVVWRLQEAERSLDGDSGESAVADVIFDLKTLLSTARAANFPQAGDFLLEAQRLVSRAATTLEGSDSENRQHELRRDLRAIRDLFEAARDGGVLAPKGSSLKSAVEALGTGLACAVALAWVGAMSLGLSIWRATGSSVAQWAFLGSWALIGIVWAYLGLHAMAERVANHEGQLLLRELCVLAEKLVGVRPGERERVAVTALRVIRRGLVLGGCVLLAIAWIISGGQSSDLAKVALWPILSGLGMMGLAALLRGLLTEVRDGDSAQRVTVHQDPNAADAIGANENTRNTSSG